jgi:hydrogenase-1 operon protein HyaF
MMVAGMAQKEKKNIRFINSLEDLSQGGNGRALLHEIVNLLLHLLREDEPSHIDLRQMSLNQKDIDLLTETLGEGEIFAELAEYGVTRIRQTGIPGVVHLDEEEQVISEFIEINYCPEALITPVEDIHDGREALQARLFEVEMERKRGKS